MGVFASVWPYPNLANRFIIPMQNETVEPAVGCGSVPFGAAYDAHLPHRHECLVVLGLGVGLESGRQKIYDNHGHSHAAIEAGGGATAASKRSRKVNN